MYFTSSRKAMFLPNLKSLQNLGKKPRGSPKIGSFKTKRTLASAFICQNISTCKTPLHRNFIFEDISLVLYTYSGLHFSNRR